MGTSVNTKAPSLIVAIASLCLPVLLLHSSACVLSAAVECRVTYKYIDANDCSAWLPAGAVPKASRDAFDKRFNTPSDQLPSHRSGTPIRSKNVSATMADVMKHMFCKACGGKGVRVRTYRLNRLVDKVVWFRTSGLTREKGIEKVVEVGPVNVNAGCAKCIDKRAKLSTSGERGPIAQNYHDVPYSYTYTGCRGTGLPAEIGNLQTLLAKLGEQALRIDSNDPRALVTRYAAQCLLEKAAFDLDSYAVDLVRLSGLAPSDGELKPAAAGESGDESVAAPDGAEAARSRPQVNTPVAADAPAVRKPVVFIGRVADLRETRYGVLLLVRLHRTQTYVAVTCKGWIPVRKGQTVFVSGIVHDPGRPVPLINAAVAVGVHRADPLFASKRPYSSAVEDSKTDADRKLDLARAYLANNMKAKAAAACREVIKEYPKTDAAEEAKELLSEIGK